MKCGHGCASALYVYTLRFHQIKGFTKYDLKFTKEIPAKENGELYGSLSVSDIVSFLKEKNINIQKNIVKLGNKIKSTGQYSVDIDLHPEVNCSLDIEILSPKTSA